MPLEKWPAVVSGAESIKHGARKKIWPVVLEWTTQPKTCKSQAEVWPDTTALCVLLFLLPPRG